MTLKKTIAGHFKEYEVNVYKDVTVPVRGSTELKIEKVFSHTEQRREWVEQKDIDMHPLEEEEFLAHWSIHEHQSKIPPKPTQEEEHEWMVEHGVDYVKSKRAEWQKAHDEIMPEVEKAQARFEAAHKAWDNHCSTCLAHRKDPNTFDGDAAKVLGLAEEVR